MACIPNEGAPCPNFVCEVQIGHKIWEIYIDFLDMWLFWHGVIQDGVILAWGYFDMGLFRMGLFWHRVILTRGYLGWGYFGLGLFWHGVILVWGYFGLGLLWFGVIMVWGYFGGVISVGLFWFGVISYCSQTHVCVIVFTFSSKKWEKSTFLSQKS